MTTMSLATAEYLAKVLLGIERQTIPVDKLTMTCPECGMDDDWALEREHVVFRPDEKTDPIPRDSRVVLIGCEGFWCVDPALVGMARDGWLPPDEQAALFGTDKPLYNGG